MSIFFFPETGITRCKTEANLHHGIEVHTCPPSKVELKYVYVFVFVVLCQVLNTNDKSNQTGSLERLWSNEKNSKTRDLLTTLHYPKFGSQYRFFKVIVKSPC